jgi:hypothetical protein
MNGLPLAEAIELLCIEASCDDDDMEEAVVPAFVLRQRSEAKGFVHFRRGFGADPQNRSDIPERSNRCHHKIKVGEREKQSCSGSLDVNPSSDTDAEIGTAPGWQCQTLILTNGSISAQEDGDWCAGAQHQHQYSHDFGGEYHKTLLLQFVRESEISRS